MLKKEILKVLLNTHPQIDYKKWAMEHALRKTDEICKVFEKYYCQDASCAKRAGVID